MFRHLFIFAWAGLLLAGCSTTLVRDEPKAIRVGESGVSCAAAPLAEALLKQRGTIVSALNGSWKDHVFSAECVVRGEEDKFTAVFLAPHMRLATLTLTPPHTVTLERARSVPAAFEPEYALFDLAVVHLPTIALKQALGGDFVVAETATTRTVSTRGQTVARRQKLPNGLTRYENLSLGYSYDLKEIR